MKRSQNEGWFQMIYSVSQYYLWFYKFYRMKWLKPRS